MSIAVRFSENPAAVLERAGRFLESRPVAHNMVLSLLQQRVASGEAGRYWIAEREGEVAGVVLQSPRTFSAAITPMESPLAAAVVDAISDAGVALPGVNGEAGAAASFAGHWTERCGMAAAPAGGRRLYELVELREGATAEGRFRAAAGGDRALLVEWVRAFELEVGEPAGDAEARVGLWLRAGQVWIWEDSEAVAMAVSRGPAAGVCRISGVYTPPRHRRRGRAEACVRELSRRIRDAGHRAILYTDLANPTSNAIYRRIGYQAVAECLHYRFGTGRDATIAVSE